MKKETLECVLCVCKGKGDDVIIRETTDYIFYKCKKCKTQWSIPK